MKKIIAFVLVIVLCLTLCACAEDAGNTLNGKYVSESGKYTIEFERNGSCTWYQDGSFFNGTYQQTENGWQLNIEGNGLYSNTVFQAEGDGKTLVITGGVVYGETFTKQ